jgi:hypothetical protein
MSSITITTDVTLDTTNNALDVDDHKKPIPVPREPDVTSLVWKLTGNAARGSFNAMDAPNKGFQFIGTNLPQPGVFGQATLAANGNQIHLPDNNSNAGSTGGPWTYQLWATINGVEYSTIATLSATTNDPQIKNN